MPYHPVGMSFRKTKSDTREALLAAARALFLRQGYTATGIDEICAEAGITKGALFHYFETKEALGRAALERWVCDGMRAFGSGPYRQEPDPLKRALGFVEFTIQISQMGPPGCIAGIFAQEMAPTNGAVRAMLADAFTGWSSHVETLIADAKAAYAPHSVIDPKSMAQHVLAVFQGSLVLARAYQNPAVIADNLRHVRAYIEAQFDVAHSAPEPRKRANPKLN